MAIGIVSSSDFMAELEKSDSHDDISPIKKLPESNPTAVIIDKPKPGRQTGSVAVPESLQKLIGATGVESRSEALNIAKSLDVSPSSVSAYSNGATSTASYNTPKPSLRDGINRTKDRIAKTASNKLKQALEHITDEKLEVASLKVVSDVARNMASIVKDMEPAKETGPVGPGSGVTFVVYSPQVRPESAFEVIELKE